MIKLIVFLRKKDLKFLLALLSSFGPNGSIYDVLPYEDSYWYNYGYTTLVTSSSLIICLFGATLFGKTVVTIFFLVSLAIIMTFASFFPAKGIIASFTYTDDEKDYCIKPDDDTESRYFQFLEIFLYFFKNFLNKKIYQIS